MYLEPTAYCHNCKGLHCDLIRLKLMELTEQTCEKISCEVLDLAVSHCFHHGL